MGIFKKKEFYGNRCYICNKELGENSLTIYLTCRYCRVKVCAKHADSLKRKGKCPLCGNVWD